MTRLDAYWGLVKWSISIGVLATVIPFLIEYYIGGGINGRPMPFSDNFSAEFLAGIIGVVAGFGLSGWATVKQDERRIPELKLIIKEELVRIRDEVGDATHHSIWVWRSLVSSVDTNLLEIDLQKKLYEIYSAIERLNIDTDSERRHRGVKDGYTSKLVEINRIHETTIYNMISELIESRMLL